MIDPRRIQFTEQVRKLIDDPDERGLNCHGCLFNKQRAAVCRVAAEEAHKRSLRDCDAIDQFGDVVIYVRCEVDPRQLDVLDGLDDEAEKHVTERKV